jgi:hypothetical protein
LPSPSWRCCSRGHVLVESAAVAQPGQGVGAGAFEQLMAGPALALHAVEQGAGPPDQGRHHQSRGHRQHRVLGAFRQPAARMHHLAGVTEQHRRQQGRQQGAPRQFAAEAVGREDRRETAVGLAGHPAQRQQQQAQRGIEADRIEGRARVAHAHGIPVGAEREQRDRQQGQAHRLRQPLPARQAGLHAEHAHQHEGQSADFRHQARRPAGGHRGRIVEQQRMQARIEAGGVLRADQQPQREHGQRQRGGCARERPAGAGAAQQGQAGEHHAQRGVELHLDVAGQQRAQQRPVQHPAQGRETAQHDHAPGRQPREAAQALDPGRQGALGAGVAHSHSGRVSSAQRSSAASSRASCSTVGSSCTKNQRQAASLPA